MIEDHHGISNVADTTNYVLMEMGHPTHAFDLDLLEGGKIVVRRARPGEKLQTLDGVERELLPEDLVIADAVKAVALAGVMGGWETMITANTRNVLVESAWFDPAGVRRTSRRLGMHTDASHRFERGADWSATTLACDRVAELILETAGGKLGAHNDAVARNLRRFPIQLERSELWRILGQKIPEADVTRILQRLGFGLTPQRVTSVTASRSTPVAAVEKPEAYTVDIPTWRMDVEREIDLIEEVARVYGFNNFANTLPSFSGGVVELPHAAAESKTRTRLLALGYDEIVSPTFISAADARRFSPAKPVALENPLSDEAPLLRNDLIPGMLNTLAWNFNRGATDIRLFETGNVFEMAGEHVDQHKYLCVSGTGSTGVVGVEQKPRAMDFFDLKGDIEAAVEMFTTKSLRFDAHASEYYHPGRSAKLVLNGKIVGEFGQLHPDVAADRKLKQEVWLAQLDLDRLFAVPLREPRYDRLSRFPAVERDFSLLLDDSVSYESLRSAIDAQRIHELRSIEPRELFRGGAVPEGKYSLLLRLTFQSAERTFVDEEIAAWSRQVVGAVKGLGGSLRA
jgi:phenylalanyl-tRNA synthetase beta chain